MTAVREYVLGVPSSVATSNVAETLLDQRGRFAVPDSQLSCVQYMQ